MMMMYIFDGSRHTMTFFLSLAGMSRPFAGYGPVYSGDNVLKELCS